MSFNTPEVGPEPFALPLRVVYKLLPVTRGDRRFPGGVVTEYLWPQHVGLHDLTVEELLAWFLDHIVLAEAELLEAVVCTEDEARRLARQISVGRLPRHWRHYEALRFAELVVEHQVGTGALRAQDELEQAGQVVLAPFPALSWSCQDCGGNRVSRFECEGCGSLNVFGELVPDPHEESARRFV